MTPIKHTFRTGRVYDFEQEVSLIITRDKIMFDDPSRSIAGYIELDDDHRVAKAIAEGLEDAAKAIAKASIMRAYDRGTHKWLAPFEAAQLFA